VTPPRRVTPVRVTPLPSALLLALVAVISVPSSAAAERWRRPVPGGVARSFSYSRAAPFRAGAHRGADLAARPGTPVRTACAGTVLFAGRVAGSAPLVTIRCGPRHVTYLPLTRLRVRRGGHVRAGAPLGAVARGHRGLHLGVRRSADRFGYEDPLALLAGPGRRWPLAGPVRRGPRHAPAPATPPTAAPTPVPAAPQARVPAPALAPASRGPEPAPAPARAPATPQEEARRPSLAPPNHGPTPTFATPRASRARRSPGAALAVPRAGSAGHGPPTGPSAPAPWPVWLGLTAVLLGAAGSGTVAVRRRRAAGHRASAAIAAPRQFT
jgi:Peptidase family M23